MTIKEAQEAVDKWIKEYGVRYFSELTNMACLTEEVGELARVIARTYGDQSFKKGEKPNLGEEMADVLWVLICLANRTDVEPRNIFHFFSEVELFALLEALIAVCSGDDTSRFSYFFRKTSHIGKFAEITNAILLDPLIYSFLCFFYCHFLTLIMGVHHDGNSTHSVILPSYLHRIPGSYRFSECIGQLSEFFIGGMWFRAWQLLGCGRLPFL